MTATPCPACEWDERAQVEDAFDLPPEPPHADDCWRSPVRHHRQLVEMFSEADRQVLRLKHMPKGEATN